MFPSGYDIPSSHTKDSIRYSHSLYDSVLKLIQDVSHELGMRHLLQCNWIIETCKFTELLWTVCYSMLFYIILLYYYILYYYILYYIIIYYIMLFYIILLYIILLYIMLLYVMLFYIILFYIILYYYILYYIITGTASPDSLHLGALLPRDKHRRRFHYNQ